jgi:hypothetical protein
MYRSMNKTIKSVGFEFAVAGNVKTGRGVVVRSDGQDLNGYFVAGNRIVRVTEGPSYLPGELVDVWAWNLRA